MQNSNDVGDISEEVRNSLDGERKLNERVWWGEKMEQAQYRYCKMASNERGIGDRDISVTRRGGMT